MRIIFAIVVCGLVTFSYSQVASTDTIDDILADVRQILCYYHAESDRITSTGTASELNRLNLEVHIWQEELYAIYGTEVVKLAAKVVGSEIREQGSEVACAL